MLRERIARHGIDCDWRDGFLGVATNARKGRAAARVGRRDRVQVRATRSRSIAPADVPQWVASGRYHSAIHDPRSGHLHPLKYVLGLARAAAAAGVRAVRAHRGHRAHAGRRRHAEDRRRRGARRPGAAGRQRLPAGRRARARVAHHAGRHLHRLLRADGPGAGRLADPHALGRLRHRLRAGLLPHHQRPPHAVRRPRQLQHEDAGQPAGEHAPAHGRHLPAARRDEDRVRVGRLRRHHDEPRARLRPHRRQRVLPAGLLGPRPRADRPGRPRRGRGHDHRREPLRPVRPPQAPRVPRRPRCCARRRWCWAWPGID